MHLHRAPCLHLLESDGGLVDLSPCHRDIGESSRMLIFLDSADVLRAPNHFLSLLK